MINETSVSNRAAAIKEALATVRQNITKFGPKYPDDVTRSNIYQLRPAEGKFGIGDNRGWTTSFVPGQQWLAYEITGDEEFLKAARVHERDFADRVFQKKDLDTHDLGFLYTLASVAPYRLIGDQEAKAAALEAADRLMDRFLEPAGIIQAWGDLSDPRQRGRTIIDSLMNMPLLTWAGEQTGDPKYAEAVRRHTAQLAKHIIRDDNSTFHTFYWDAETGEPLRGATEQGAFDDSCWARGQAWGIYGFTMNYQATGNEDLLVAARRCADYFLDHLPADGIPYWDLVYGDGSGEPRDSSAAAIAACGLQELARSEIDPERAKRYAAAGEKMMDDLLAYTPASEGVKSDALLLHSVYDYPKKNGVDEGCLWGDYFFLEALMRYTNPEWRRYW